MGITRTEFVRMALEKALGITNPSRLLKTLRNGTPTDGVNASAGVSEKVKRKLRAKRSA